VSTSVRQARCRWGVGYADRPGLNWSLPLDPAAQRGGRAAREDFRETLVCRELFGVGDACGMWLLRNALPRVGPSASLSPGSPVADVVFSTMADVPVPEPLLRADIGPRRCWAGSGGFGPLPR